MGFRPSLQGVYPILALLVLFSLLLSGGSIYTISILRNSPGQTWKYQPTQPVGVTVIALLYGIFSTFLSGSVIFLSLRKGSIGYIIASVEIVFAILALLVGILIGTFYSTHGGCSGAQTWLGLTDTEDNGGICGTWRFDIAMASLSMLFWLIAGGLHFFCGRSNKQEDHSFERGYEQRSDRSLNGSTLQPDPSFQQDVSNQESDRPYYVSPEQIR